MANHEKQPLIRWFEEIGKGDVAEVGGKNASLGEMIRNLKDAGVRVPGGFATTSAAYHAFLRHNDLTERIQEQLNAYKKDNTRLSATGDAIRRAFRQSSFPEDLADAVRSAYDELSRRAETENVAVAVRSSATAEDLPEASFAGQQETFLNIRGPDDLLTACRDCFASLFTDRAINYREERGFDHMKVALSVGIQKMIRSDLAGAGVMFSLDTDSGFPDLVVINAAWGLGETVVQGSVDPDEYRVFKPLLENKSLRPIIGKRRGAKQKKLVYASGGSKTTKLLDTPAAQQKAFVLSDDDILELARWAVIIEKHYQTPMDMEWAKDGESGRLYCVQARPETIHARKQTGTVRTWQVKGSSEVLVRGVAVGQAAAAGPAKVLHSPDQMGEFKDGDVLVTERTDPDWGPIMKRAAAIVTDHGGRTSHAAIVSRELGIPAVVGAEHATHILKNKQEITVSCAEGQEGRVYDGRLRIETAELDPASFGEPPVQLMINLAHPAGAFRWWQLPVRGVGLARMEFIISNIIKIHPLALTRFEDLEDPEVKKAIAAITEGWEDKREFFIESLARGISEIAASQYPDPAIVRLSDFKTNEYAQLIGGQPFEPHEENPMLGFRGASRYYSDRYKDGFALECEALRRAREETGLSNIVVMIPFVRTVEEADQVLAAMADYGLKRGQNGLEVYMMCEIPSNIFLADEFAARFDGFSIGSNDLTQLILGVDRDSEELSRLFDERNAAVKKAIAGFIKAAHKHGRKVGICGQAPSDYPDFAQFLLESGIDSISLNPDSVVATLRHLAARGGKS